MSDQPIVWLVAGPNGVGKTTYARHHIEAVSGTVRFVDLNEIARGLSPFRPDAERAEAARVALARIDALLRGNGTRSSFTIETTLAGRTYLRRLGAARERGWRVHLLYFAVASPEIALARIARRVSEGGHHVPDDDARRRFARSVANLPAYLRLADLWRVYDNTGPHPRTAAEGGPGCVSYMGDLKGLPADLAAVLAALRSCPDAPV